MADEQSALNRLRERNVRFADMWLDQQRDAPEQIGTLAPRAVAIAVPARDEAASVRPCLAALLLAADHPALVGSAVTILLAANNCTDETAARARAMADPRIRVIEIELPPAHAHAGGARGAALDAAAALLPESGVLMTTDADSRVAPDWIAANLAEIEAGADAVAGMIAFDDAERARLPAMPGRDREWELAGLQARIASLIDPRAHDPWPNHIWAWGASLALTAHAYRASGGVPLVPLAEDRALAAAIEAADLKLRHSHAPLVFTSARTGGRAPGGFADLVRSYTSDAGALCDAALEPTDRLVARLRWRRRLRDVHARSGPAEARTAAAALLDTVPPATGFGALWSLLEAAAPALARQRLSPDRLATEIPRAERVIRLLERRAADRADISPCAAAA